MVNSFLAYETLSAIRQNRLIYLVQVGTLFYIYV